MIGFKVRIRSILAIAGLASALCSVAGTANARPAGEPSPARSVADVMAAAPTLYMVRYRPGPAYRHDRALLQQDLRAHGAYLQDLARRGTVIAAGPTFAEAGGLVLVRAASLEEARAIMDADPAVEALIFIGELSDWRPFFDPGERFRTEVEPR